MDGEQKQNKRASLYYSHLLLSCCAGFMLHVFDVVIMLQAFVDALYVLLLVVAILYMGWWRHHDVCVLLLKCRAYFLLLSGVYFFMCVRVIVIKRVFAIVISCVYLS